MCDNSLADIVVVMNYIQDIVLQEILFDKGL